MLYVKATIILFAHLAALTSEVLSTSTVQIPDGPSQACLNVSKEYNNADPNLRTHLYLYGRRRTVEVQWGSGDTNKVSAALLVAALKYKFNYEYEDVVLVKGKETLCDLAGSLPPSLYDHPEAFDRAVIHVGAATSENDGSCKALSVCDDTSKTCGMAGPRLHVMGQAMAPVEFYANLSSLARKDPRCTNITWNLYSDVNILRDCGFLPTNITHSLFKCAVPDNEYINLNCVVRECNKKENCTYDLSKHCIPIVLDLDFDHSRYKEYTKALAGRIRKDKLKFQLISLSELNLYCCNTSNFSYIFLSTPRHHSRPAYRVANGDILEQWAPKIFHAVRLFNPKPEHIIEILQYNLTSANLEEAVCKHASNRGSFGDWADEVKTPLLYASLVLCKGDPNNNFYEDVANIIGKHLSIMGIKKSKEINCSSENDFNVELCKMTREGSWMTTIGVVGRGAGATQAAATAAAMETQLVLYDVPPDTATLSVSARTATGKVTPLALATRYFLKENQWRRIAIISDQSQLAKDFSNALLGGDPALAPRKVELDGDDLKASAENILHRLRDGRVFIVNTDMEAAAELLCAALQLKMTANEGYVWIVRSWGDPACDMKEMRFFTVTYWWRGGNDSVLPSDASASELRAKINKALQHTNYYSKSIWPPLTAPLADSLLLLFYATSAGFSYDHDLFYDLHGRNATRKISKSFDAKEPKQGIVQILKQRDYALESPLVFLYDWRGNTTCSLSAVWRVENGNVKVERTIYKVYSDESAAVPSDGTKTCVLTDLTTGDPYDPSCKDIPVFSSVSLLVMILVGSFVVYRYKMKTLKQRDHIMQMRLLARSERTSEALGPYLVKRSALQIQEELGIGNFGRVHFGILTFPKRTVAVAVKSLREDASLAEESQFLREACLLSQLNHVNIVRLVGVCAADGPPLVMMEHAFFCDLRRYLKQRRHYSEVKDYHEYELIDSEATSISPRELTRLTREAASALAYLSFKRIVHRDVRAANCLIDDRRTLKLADFGMARESVSSRKIENLTTIGRETYNMTTISEPLDYSYFCKRRGDKFPITWMAPESIERGEFSSASDVWSLGVMMIEIVMLGDRPFGTWSPQRVYEYLISEGVPQLPLQICYKTLEVIEMCWWKEPRKRATAATIISHLTANPTAICHAVVTRDTSDRVTTEVSSPSTSDSGYCEMRIKMPNDPRISTN